MRRSVVLAMTILLLCGTAHAQGPDHPQPDSFRIEWARRQPWMRPGVDGYVYNDSVWRVSNVRLRVRVVDGSGGVVRESYTWVLGDVTSGGRSFFVLPVIAVDE